MPNSAAIPPKLPPPPPPVASLDFDEPLVIVAPPSPKTLAAVEAVARLHGLPAAPAAPGSPKQTAPAPAPASPKQASATGHGSPTGRSKRRDSSTAPVAVADPAPPAVVTPSVAVSGGSPPASKPAKQQRPPTHSQSNLSTSSPLQGSRRSHRSFSSLSNGSMGTALADTSSPSPAAAATAALPVVEIETTITEDEIILTLESVPAEQPPQSPVPPRIEIRRVSDPDVSTAHAAGADEDHHRPGLHAQPLRGILRLPLPPKSSASACTHRVPGVKAVVFRTQLTDIKVISRLSLGSVSAEDILNFITTPDDVGRDDHRGGAPGGGAAATCSEFAINELGNIVRLDGTSVDSGSAGSGGAGSWTSASAHDVRPRAGSNPERSSTSGGGFLSPHTVTSTALGSASRRAPASSTSHMSRPRSMAGVAAASTLSNDAALVHLRKKVSTTFATAAAASSSSLASAAPSSATVTATSTPHAHVHEPEVPEAIAREFGITVIPRPKGAWDDHPSSRPGPGGSSSGPSGVVMATSPTVSSSSKRKQSVSSTKSAPSASARSSTHSIASIASTATTGSTAARASMWSRIKDKVSLSRPGSGNNVRGSELAEEPGGGGGTGGGGPVPLREEKKGGLFRSRKPTM
ncbi:hypothetical protein H9P43_004019 [Blastocladiella emersonii ATCC 22665]|nr:hypothetical protein H9P43_004019 [Blastocladiella emersonii ATCC 22665]